MFGIGGFELFLILLFAFLVFGPDKLPEMARTAGELIARFRQAQEEMNSVVRSELLEKDAPKSGNKPSATRRNATATAKPAPKSAAGATSQEDDDSVDAPNRVVRAVDEAADAAKESARQARAEKSQATESFAERKARYEYERRQANRKAMRARAAEAEEVADKLPSAAELYGTVPPRPKPRPQAAESASTADPQAQAAPVESPVKEGE